ncbi:hypothetical protein [Aeromonas sobria]|uniref:hypothetical protein n=1 Tax=Aeromonas sobria TaxID=646 RepID=UPI003F34A902
MVKKKTILCSALLFSCTPLMMAHAKYGDEIPLQISAYIESETCDVVIDAENDVNIQLPEMGIDQVELFYKDNTDKVHFLTPAKNIRFRCAAGKSAKFSIFALNSCEASTTGWGGCLANNKSLGYRLSFNYQDPDNVKVNGNSSDNPGLNAMIRTILLDDESSLANLNIHAIRMFPVKDQIPTPGETGADHILRIWAQ